MNLLGALRRGLHLADTSRLGNAVWLWKNFDAATVRLVRRHFDEAYYLNANPDVVQLGLDPVLHFLRYGWDESREPTPKFSARVYLARHPEVATSGEIPFVHWVQSRRPTEEAKKAIFFEIQSPADEPEKEEDWSSASVEEIVAIRDDFDGDWYLKQYPHVARRGLDPVLHYLRFGWRKGYDPTPWFGTRFYQATNPDVRRAGANPFVHYCTYGRRERREPALYSYIERATYTPLVSIIMPSLNDATSLRERIECVAAQTYRSVELIVLDDGSTDCSQEVIRDVVAELGLEAELIFNDENSGSVFKLWRNGIDAAKGDLIWICESDEFCEPDFLELLVPHFVDQSVNIAFGTVQIVDEDGRLMEELDEMREGAEPGIWHDTLVRPASEWFNRAFGNTNVVFNAVSCLFRRQALPDNVWEAASSFRISGDWYLYLHLAGAGQIAYEPDAVAYFRQHSKNSLTPNLNQLFYFEESGRILAEIIRHWGISDDTRTRFVSRLEREFAHHGLEAKYGAFKDNFPVNFWLATERDRQHIQLYTLGFQLGGGEIFPIELANALRAKGNTVSLVVNSMTDRNDQVRSRLDPAIPVYHAQHLWKKGRAGFLETTGVSVIHSHIVNADVLLAQTGEGPIERPYVVTLHGSYTGFPAAPNSMIDWVLANVTRWVYLTDRNLEFFTDRGFATDRFIRLPNALPRDSRPVETTRADLGIAEDDIVFFLAGRAIEGKGWRAAIRAMHELHNRGHHKPHLLLAGDGPMIAEATELAGKARGIQFLSFRSDIDGLLRQSDCLLLPTRFEGESYPLILLQALQLGVPALASDVGEIADMMQADGDIAGLLIPASREDARFEADLVAALETMCDPDVLARSRKTAVRCSDKFDLPGLVARYLEIYEGVQAEAKIDPLA